MQRDAQVAQARRGQRVAHLLMDVHPPTSTLVSVPS
jgi:hypothetical protein